MARFYGSVQGNRGEAHRLGHAKGGLRVEARTWSHDVTVHLYADANDVDCVSISCRSLRLYSGAISELAKPQQLIERMARNMLDQEFGCTAGKLYSEPST